MLESRKMPSPSTLEVEAPARMAPVRPRRRIEIVDMLRGFSILGILIFNMLGYSGFLYTPLDQLGYFGRITVLLIKFFVQAKFYTLFSFLFGWGMAIQLERATQRGARFVFFYLRRLLVLLGIGFTHAILLWAETASRGRYFVRRYPARVRWTAALSRSSRTSCIACPMVFLVRRLAMKKAPFPVIRGCEPKPKRSGGSTLCLGQRSLCNLSRESNLQPVACENAIYRSGEAVLFST